MILSCLRERPRFCTRVFPICALPAFQSKLSLLARLAGGEPVEADHCWESGLIELAKEDGPKLRRAGYAASLAAVGRVVYAALVELCGKKRIASLADARTARTCRSSSTSTVPRRAV